MLNFFVTYGVGEMHDGFLISAAAILKSVGFSYSPWRAALISKTLSISTASCVTKLSTWGGNIGEDWNADREV